jgi:hypothetical protein
MLEMDADAWCKITSTDILSKPNSNGYGADNYITPPDCPLKIMEDKQNV